MKFRVALLVASVLSAPAAALAQPVTGPYVSLGAGVDFVLDQHLRGSSSEFYAGTTRLQNDLGGVGLGSVGYGLGNGFRVEIQGDWGATKEERGFNATSNYQQQYHGFLNVLYDLDGSIFGHPGISPYVGLGAGYGVSHFSNLNIGTYNYTTGATTLLHTTGTYGDAAFQGIVGFAVNIAQVPGLALTAEYRFVTTPFDSNYHAQYFDATGGFTGVKLKTEGQYNNEALIGVRYALFAAPPPPPPSVAPAAVAPVPPGVAKTYLVFFDWDRADLTTRARQIVAQAAAASTSTQSTRIEVNGYTDLSGTAAYNQRLSVRRAESVESELVRDGVNRSEISIHGFGETNPLVQTAKGVREPQNRRVEIILH